MNIEPDKKIVSNKNILKQLKDNIVFLILGLVGNNLNENIKSCDNLNSFKIALKDHIINSN